MVPYQIALFVRRLYAKFYFQKPGYVKERLKEIKAGRYDEEIDRLIEAGQEELQQKYACRDIEKI